jgi:hypothetical protein
MSLQPARAGTVDVGSVDRDAWSRVAAGIGLSARMRLVREAVAALHDGLDHARFGQGCTQPRDRHFDGVLVLTMPIQRVEQVTASYYSAGVTGEPREHSHSVGRQRHESIIDDHGLTADFEAMPCYP